MNKKATVTYTSFGITDYICFDHYLIRSERDGKNGRPYIAFVQYDDLGMECVDCSSEE